MMNIAMAAIADDETVLGKPTRIDRKADGTTTLGYGRASHQTDAAAFIPVGAN